MTTNDERSDGLGTDRIRAISATLNELWEVAEDFVGTIGDVHASSVEDPQKTMMIASISEMNSAIETLVLLFCNIGKRLETKVLDLPSEESAVAKQMKDLVTDSLVSGLVETVEGINKDLKELIPVFERHLPSDHPTAEKAKELSTGLSDIQLLGQARGGRG